MGRAVAFSRFHPRRAPCFDTAFFVADSLRIENTAVHPTRYFVLLLLFFYAVPVGASCTGIGCGGKGMPTEGVFYI